MTTYNQKYSKIIWKNKEKKTKERKWHWNVAMAITMTHRVLSKDANPNSASWIEVKKMFIDFFFFFASEQ